MTVGTGLTQWLTENSRNSWNGTKKPASAAQAQRFEEILISRYDSRPWRAVASRVTLGRRPRQYSRVTASEANMNYSGVLLFFLVLLVSKPALAATDPTSSPDELERSVAMMAKIGACWSPSFSPDGKRIVLVSNLNGIPQVWTVPTEGGWPELVSALDDQVGSVSFGHSSLLVGHSSLFTFHSSLFSERRATIHERRDQST